MYHKQNLPLVSNFTQWAQTPSWLIDMRLNWLFFSAPSISAAVAPEDYNSDCISIFNGKCQNIQSSSRRVHGECFASLATLRKTNWLHYRLHNAHLLFVIIKWHVFVLSWNWLCCTAHQLWGMMLYYNPISHFWVSVAVINGTACYDVSLNQLALLPLWIQWNRQDNVIPLHGLLLSLLWPIRPRFSA